MGENPGCQDSVNGKEVAQFHRIKNNGSDGKVCGSGRQHPGIPVSPVQQGIGGRLPNDLLRNAIVLDLSEPRPKRRVGEMGHGSCIMGVPDGMDRRFASPDAGEEIFHVGLSCDAAMESVRGYDDTSEIRATVDNPAARAFHPSVFTLEAHETTRNHIDVPAAGVKGLELVFGGGVKERTRRTELGRGVENLDRSLAIQTHCPEGDVVVMAHPIGKLTAAIVVGPAPVPIAALLVIGNERRRPEPEIVVEAGRGRLGCKGGG